VAAASPAEGKIADEVARLVRDDGGRLLAHLISALRDFQLAEDCFQDAVEAALIHWRRTGLPRSPQAWLVRTAQRKAIDRIRRAANFRSKSVEIAALIALDAETAEAEPDAIADDRLKLIFTCCHPALDRSTSVALTLRSVAGLRTEEIARAFVVGPDAMAQRLVRARHKIARAGIRYEVPGPDGWGERLEGVLAVIYLMFNEGYAASSDIRPRVDLCEEAIRLGRLLVALTPGEAEAEGLLALMLFHQARSRTRAGMLGEMLTLEEQDRSLWDRAAIAEATALLTTALRRGHEGIYQFQAAIAAEHAGAESFDETDWAEIALIYDALIAVRPNPVFELNRIVALFYAAGPDMALRRLGAIKDALAGYQPYHAVRAHILGAVGEVEAARIAFDAAIALSGTEAERAFLSRRRNALA